MDIFAGPGGLGEGFSACLTGRKGNQRAAFELSVSAEMDSAAHRTLRLRAFFRRLQKAGKPLDSYYAYLASPLDRNPFNDVNQNEWEAAGREALNLTLGKLADNEILYRAIAESAKGSKAPWILIGGPPCQAYSVVGRVRNQGRAGYSPEKDHRHYLYREYLQILQRFSPDAFILENVRGILSSKVSGQQIFQQMIEDLSSPAKALGRGATPAYDIVPLVRPATGELDEADPSRYLIFSEKHGIPQTRHRVILLGIRRGSGLKPRILLAESEQTRLRDALLGLPKLRSGLSEETDGALEWSATVTALKKGLVGKLRRTQLYSSVADYLHELQISPSLSRGAVSKPTSDTALRKQGRMPEALSEWLLDDRLRSTLNHETRSHATSDLERYMFSAAFTHVHDVSPKSRDFPESLAPNHASWSEGKFADRFRTQRLDCPSGTITSHISKDGHHFIHPDAAQCRSLTVREAARLQTFPDNYFFLGNRTQQYVQVGNAVPPLLANRIASIVADMFSR